MVKPKPMLPLFDLFSLPLWLSYLTETTWNNLHKAFYITSGIPIPLSEIQNLMQLFAYSSSTVNVI